MLFVYGWDFKTPMGILALELFQRHWKFSRGVYRHIHVLHQHRRILVAWILVSLNIRAGLKEEVNNIWGQARHKKRLDYKGVHFLCHQCHHYGHIANNCNLHFIRVSNWPLKRLLRGEARLDELAQKIGRKEGEKQVESHEKTTLDYLHTELDEWDAM